MVKESAEEETLHQIFAKEVQDKIVEFEEAMEKNNCREMQQEDPLFDQCTMLEDALKQLGESLADISQIEHYEEKPTEEL